MNANTKEVTTNKQWTTTKNNNNGGYKRVTTKTTTTTTTTTTTAMTSTATDKKDRRVEKCKHKRISTTEKHGWKQNQCDTVASPLKAVSSSHLSDDTDSNDSVSTSNVVALDPIEKEIQLLEEEIHLLQEEEEEAKRRTISKSLIHLIHSECNHIDWNQQRFHPRPVLPPRRVLDWSPELLWTPGLDRTNLVAIKKDPIIVGRLNASIRVARTPEEKCAAQLRYCQDVMECYTPEKQGEMS